MNVWKAVCAALVIFLAGIITGATLVRIAQARPGPRWIQRPGMQNAGQPNPGTPMNPGPPNEPRPPNTGPQGLLSREFIQILERQLELTPDQRERVGKIMADGQERVRELRSRIDPEMRKELQQTREQIRAVLTPEQRERFEQLMKRTSRRNDRGDVSSQPDRSFRDARGPVPQDAPPPPPPDR